MKHLSKLTVISLSGLVMIFLFFACRRTIGDYTENNKDLDIASAKKYYKTVLKTEGREVSSKFSSNPEKSGAPANKKYIMWKKAYESKTDKFSFVEAPLFYNQKISYIIHRDGSPASNFDKKIFAASLTRLIVYKDPNTGRKGQYIINYIPDSAYLVKHGFDISHNQIDHLDRDYTGYIKYMTWDGEPKAIFKFKDGKVVSRGRYKTETLTGSNSRKTTVLNNSRAAMLICTSYTEWVTITECYSTDPENPTMDNIVCTAYTIPVTYEECYEDDPGGGGNDDPCMDPANWNLPECGGGDPDPGGDPGCRGCDPTPPTQVQTVVNNVDNPCLNQVYNKITLDKFKNTLSRMMQNFQSLPNFNISITTNNSLGSTTYGRAYGAGDGSTYTIEMHTDLLSQCSEEFIASIYFHEAIHVFLKSHQETWANENASEHDEMFKNYFDQLTTAVKEVYPTLSTRDAMCMIMSCIQNSDKDPDFSKAMLDAATQALMNIMSLRFPELESESEILAIAGFYAEGGPYGTRSGNCQ